MRLTNKVTERFRTISRAVSHVTWRKLLKSKIIPSHTGYTPFLILGHGRTGTTMLVSLLQSHKQCICYSELLHPHGPKWFYDHLEYLKYGGKLRNSDLTRFVEKFAFNRKFNTVKAVGFKALYCNLNPRKSKPISCENNLEKFIKYLKSRGTKILHIKRKNKIKRYVSAKMAKKRNKWVAKSKKEIEKTKIDIDKENMLSSISFHEKEELNKKKLFSDFDVLEVCYENFVKDNEEIRKVQKFLGLPVECLKADTIRTRQRSMRKVISNYEELKKWAENNKYERYLD